LGLSDLHLAGDFKNFLDWVKEHMIKWWFGVLVCSWLWGVGLGVGKVHAQDTSGWASTCKLALANYGQASLSDSNEDGKLNMLDWAECLPKGGVGSQGGVALLSASSIEGQAVPGELIIQLNDISQLENLRSAVEVESVQRLATLTMADLNFVKVKLKNQTDSGTAAAFNQIRLADNYKSVILNRIKKISAIPNDPIFPNNQWNLSAIQAPEAWDLLDPAQNVLRGTRNDPNIFAAVIDSGVKLDHPDLAANLYGNWQEWKGGVASGAAPPGYRNQVNDDGYYYLDEGDQRIEVVDDVFGIRVTPEVLINTPAYDESCQDLGEESQMNADHGTKVNGVIAAVGNNNQGISGVNWKARILNISTLYHTINSASEPICIPGISESEIETFDYASYLNAPVISISLINECLPPVSESLCQLIKEENTNEAKDLYQRFTHDESGNIKRLVIATTRNERINIDEFKSTGYYNLPCDLDNDAIICVTSTDFNQGEERLADFASYGPVGMDLAAPGMPIAVTVPNGGNPEGYEPAAGNSFAVPHVTGAVLLMMQANPDLTMEQIRDIIFATVDTKEDVPSFGLDFWPGHPEYALEDKVKTGGRLNLYKAVKCAQDLKCLQPPPPGSWSTGASGGTSRYWHTATEHNGKIYYWGGQKSTSAMAGLDIYNVATNSWQSPTSGGGTLRRSHTAVKYGGQIYYWGGVFQSTSVPNNSLDIYDLSTGQWRQGPAGGTARSSHTGLEYQGKIYYWGGIGPNGNTPINDLDVYDPVTNRWNPSGVAHPQGGTARYGHTAALVNDKIYYLGGVTTGDIPVHTIDVYDLAANQWMPEISVPDSILLGAWSPALVYDGRIYYWRGCSSYTGVSGLMEIYDPVYNRWYQGAEGGTARNDCAGAVYNNQFYYWSGRGAGNIMDIYDPTGAGESPTPTPTIKPCGAQCVPSNECYPLERRRSDEYCSNNYVCCYPPPPTPTVPPGNYTWSGCASGSFSSPYCPPPAVVWGSACDQPGQTYYCYSGNCQDTGTADPCHGVQAPDGQVPIWGCTCQ
jgi:hypothetical protein